MRRKFELHSKRGEVVMVDGVVYADDLTTKKNSCICAINTDTFLHSPAQLRHGSRIRIGCADFIFASFF